MSAPESSSAGAGSRPWESEYTVAETRVVKETDTLRVLAITLSPTDEIPWHRHTAIDAVFVGMEGGLRVETRDPGGQHLVRPGGMHTVEAGQVHQVKNNGPGICRFLLIEGVGTYDFERC